MFRLSAIALGVYREKEWNALVGPGARKPRDCRREGLEVKVAHGRSDLGKRTGEVAAHDVRIRHHGAPDEVLRERHGELGRYVAHFADARGVELGALLGGESRQLVKAVIHARCVSRAVREVRARVWPVAVVAGLDQGRGTRDDLVHGLDVRAHRVEQTNGFFVDAVKPEQLLRIGCLGGADEGVVQRQYAGVPHIEAGTAQDPELDRGVEDEDVLDPRRRLHLDHAPTPRRKFLEDVRAGHNAAMLEGGFEQDGCAIFHQLSGLADRLVEVQVIRADQSARRVAPTCEFADLVAGVEDELGKVVDGCGQIPLVDVVPKAKVALAAGYESGLGEALYCRHLGLTFQLFDGGSGTLG